MFASYRNIENKDRRILYLAPKHIFAETELIGNEHEEVWHDD